MDSSRPKLQVDPASLMMIVYVLILKWTLGGGCLSWLLPCCWCYKQISIIEAVCVL